jgi:two-component system LytT family response regulator
MVINCAIIDDDIQATSLLSDYVNKTGFLNLIGAYQSAIEAIKDVRENNIHLVFLGIKMPELSGLEFAKILPKDTKVIFTTAHAEYAIEGYKVNALDYLLKPISYEDFFQAASKALEWFNNIGNKNTYFNDRFIFVKSDYKLVKINLDDIIYIEGVKDYIKIVMEGKEPILSLMNMKKLEKCLPSPEFQRIHRSYIAHMSKIEYIDRSRIVFGKEFIPISESYKEVVRNFLGNHTIS